MQSPALATCRSALEAGVRFTVVEQVADAVHRVLEQGGCGKDNDAHLGVDKRDGSKSGDETGDFPDEAEVFECFHGDHGGGVNE